MNHKLNGWNNNLTPFDGVGGKPGYHEKIPIMTPEQQKAKEIVEKYRKITYIDEYGNENYERLSLGAAKACAIEEVKAVLEELPDLVYGHFEDAPHQKIAVDNPRTMYWKQLLTEIEKL